MNSYILSALDSAKIDFQQKANDGCPDATDDLVGIMSTIDFIEQVAEIAFGDNAINRDFSPDDILDKLREHSDNAWKYERIIELGDKFINYRELSDEEFENGFENEHTMDLILEDEDLQK